MGYQHTSTAAAEPCNVAALRFELCKIPGVEVASVCVWGELICNPGFYGYRERGLDAKWLCFGVAAALEDCSDDSVLRMCKQLTLQGFAHSVSSGGKLRLLLCPALRQLLKDVAGCEVVDEQ